MASYKVKVHMKKLDTESGRIAFALELIDIFPWNFRKDWLLELRQKRPLEIYDGIYIVDDGTSGLYYTVMAISEYHDRYVYKVVHRYGTYQENVAMLNAQKWHVM